MASTRLEKVLEERLDEFGRIGRLKGMASVITGVVPPRNGKGPRYLLDGEGDRPFLPMNSNGYLGLALNATVMAAEDTAVRQCGTGPGAVRNYPVVPKGDEEIRFQISADHTPADIDEALAALRRAPE
jgi:glycine C-acetyltransferase